MHPLGVGVSPLRLADANSGSHRGSRRSPQDSRLPRPAIPAPSCGSGSPQPTTHAHRILTVNRPPLPTCVGTLPSFRSCMRNLVCKSVCGPKIPLANSRQSGFARLGRRISVHAHEKTALDSPMLSDQFLTTPH